MSGSDSHVVFSGDRLVFEGDLSAVAAELHSQSHAQRAGVVIFAVQSGRELDLDLSGSATDVAARYPAAADSPPALAADPAQQQPAPRKRGRPKLGVVGREITLLPRHWNWLDTQRGGASAALRRLVDAARKELAGEDAARQAQDRTHRLLTTLAGNLPGFEEAIRALYAHDQAGFAANSASWSADVQRIAKEWATDAWTADA